MKLKPSLAEHTKLPDLSDSTRLKQLILALRLSNNDFMTKAKKRFTLLRLGVRKEVVDELCAAPKLDRKTFMEQVRQRALKESRELEKEYRARSG